VRDDVAAVLESPVREPRVRPRPPAPAPLLDAGDVHHQLASGRHQEARVRDPVLLGTDQLLAEEHQHGRVSRVLHADVGHRPALAHLVDVDPALREGLGERNVGEAAGSPLVPEQERPERELLARLPRSQVDRVEELADRGRGVMRGRLRHRVLLD
jgi:hypothetical protein